MKFSKIMMCALALTGLFSSVQAQRYAHRSFKVVNETGEKLNYQVEVPSSAGSIDPLGSPVNWRRITVGTYDFDTAGTGATPIFAPVYFYSALGSGANRSGYYKLEPREILSTLIIKPGRNDKELSFQEKD